jgi:RNA transcription, translation and transport factor protein
MWHTYTDDKVDRAAVALKMLYLSDLRDLQDEVNEVIQLAQEYTANP